MTILSKTLTVSDIPNHQLRETHRALSKEIDMKHFKVRNDYKFERKVYVSFVRIQKANGHVFMIIVLSDKWKPIIQESVVMPHRTYSVDLKIIVRHIVWSQPSEIASADSTEMDIIKELFMTVLCHPR